MKILITNPPWPGEGFGARSDVRWPHKRSDKFIEYPIYLAYLVAVARQAGFEAAFLDAILEELDVESFARRVKEIGSEMVVLECSTPSIKHDLASAAAIKRLSPKTRVVLVGSHPTVFHNEIIEENSGVDAICRGEFDFTVRDAALACAGKLSWDKVLGLSRRENGRVIVNPDRPLIENLDEIPFPARDLVWDERYRQGTFRGKRPTTVITSRGCPFRCVYCLWPRTLYGNKFRARSAENVVAEIAEAVNRFGVDEVYFDDDSMGLDKQRMLDICRLIGERNLKFEWISQCRVDSMDDEILQAMKKAGCRYIRFGVESGSPEMLKIMKKGTTPEKIVNAFRLARSVGIRTQAFFLFGVPGETKETIRETIDFAKKLRPDSAQFAVVIPHPGTELFALSREKGWLHYKDWEDFSSCRAMIETPQLSLREVEEARVRAYKEFYFRPAFMLQTAAHIRSWDDLKSVLTSARSIVSRIGFFQK
ncbi:MAG: radical SAM protein [Candidatus Aureabacteria bacterium]|nr:radical SAM protein [Candidatus Auribacterota bacterium]